MSSEAKNDMTQLPLVSVPLRTLAPVFVAGLIGCAAGPTAKAPETLGGTDPAVMPSMMPGDPANGGASIVAGGAPTPDAPPDEPSASTEPTPAAASATPAPAAPAPPSGAVAPVMSPQASAAFDAGLASFQRADLAAALRSFTAATQADPKAYRAHHALGTVHERLGSVDAALSSYERSYAVFPGFEIGIVDHARLLAESGRLADAERLVTQRRSSSPKSAALVAVLAEIKSLMKDSATAQQLAQDALKLDSKFTPAMLAIARDHYRSRRLDLALYALKAILDGFGEANPPRDKTSAEARLLRATIWLEQDRRVMAMNEFKSVMDLRPDLVMPRLRYATYLLESGAALDAIPLLQKALQYDAKNLAGHLSLGDAYRLTGDYAKARAEFDWVRKQDAALPAVYYNTGLLYLFAPSMSGMDARQQVDAAVVSLTKFKELANKAELGDVDELLKRASLKKVELDAIAAANAPPPPPEAPPPPDGGTSTPSNDAGGN